MGTFNNHQLPACDTLYAMNYMFSSDKFVENFIEENHKRLTERHRKIEEYFDNLEGVKYVKPKSGLWVFFKLLFISTWEQEDQFLDLLKTEKGVMIQQGKIYKTPEPGWFRMCITSKDYDNVYEACTRIFSNLKSFKKKEPSVEMKIKINDKESVKIHASLDKSIKLLKFIKTL